MNQLTFDPKKQMPALLETWVAKSNAKQRAGRAGRVRSGTCYHLYTSTRFAAFDDQEAPEISRVPLQQLCLQIKLLKLGNIAKFLGNVSNLVIYNIYEQGN